MHSKSCCHILNIYNFINKYVNKKIKKFDKNTTEEINTKVTYQNGASSGLDRKGNMDLIPGPGGKVPGEGNGYASILPWWAMVHGIVKNQTQMSN